MTKKHAPFYPPLVWSAIVLGILGGFGLGAIMESSGIFVYLVVIMRALIRFKPNPAALAAAGIMPFLVVSLVGWSVYAWINFAGALRFLYSPELLIDVHWDRLATGSYVYLVLLPSICSVSGTGSWEN